MQKKLYSEPPGTAFDKKWKRIKMDQKDEKTPFLNPIAVRKAKIVYNIGLSECNRV